MSTGSPERLLVVANETVAGQSLIDAVRERAQRGPIKVVVVCPQNQPRHGNVVYDDVVRAAAENRITTTLAQLREAGIEAEGEVMDPDPFSATTDAFEKYGADRILISTHPETRSGWLRRDLVDRVRDAVDVPVEHIVVDLDEDLETVTNTLVVANQTACGDDLLDVLKRKQQETPHRFVVISPIAPQEGRERSADRLAEAVARLQSAGLEAVGQVMDPDPFTAVQNAMQFYAIDEIVVSTFPETRSGWLRQDLIERLERSTARPVEHVVVDVPEKVEA